MTIVLDTHCVDCVHQRCTDCRVVARGRLYATEEEVIKTKNGPGSSTKGLQDEICPTLSTEESFHNKVSSELQSPKTDTHHASLSVSPAIISNLYDSDMNSSNKESSGLPGGDSAASHYPSLGSAPKQQEYITSNAHKSTTGLIDEHPHRSAASLGDLEASDTTIESDAETCEFSPLLQDEQDSLYATSEQDGYESGQEDDHLGSTQAMESPTPLELSHIVSNSASVMILKWLESLQDEPYYEILAQACENILQNASADGENVPAQNSSTHPNSTEHSRPSRTRGKRKASDSEGEEEANSPSPTMTTKARPAKIRTKPKFACHFWKMNQHLYAECSHKGYGQVCHLAAHLRKEHSLREHSCPFCWRPFDSAEDLNIHKGDGKENACRETGGTPVHKLEISKAHMGDYKKWFWVWERLFPLIKEKPESPYWEPLDSNEQLLSSQREYLSADLATRLSPQDLEAVMASLSRFHEHWITNPPEPRRLSPLPTPTGTQSSGEAEQNRLHLLRRPETEGSQASTFNTQGVLEIDVDSLIAWPENTPTTGELESSSQEPSDNVRGGFTETHLFSEPPTASLDMNFDAWGDQLGSDEQAMHSLSNLGTDEFEFLLNQLDGP
ncbi:hypothetical protein F5Y05DRAFT_422310 [Hypoxylon sp. FL0543]|nr:hypothetical protein F5Y05DRAFT_422310 [Hypoxylon sp. FL0543]